MYNDNKGLFSSIYRKREANVQNFIILDKPGVFSPRAVTGLPRPPQWKQISGCGRETLGEFNRCGCTDSPVQSVYNHFRWATELNSCPETSRERERETSLDTENTKQAKRSHAPRGRSQKNRWHPENVIETLLKLQTEPLENITKMFILLRNITQWVTVIIYNIVDAQKHPLHTIITPLIAATHLPLKSFQLRGFSHYNEPRPRGPLTKLSKDRESTRSSTLPLSPSHQSSEWRRRRKRHKEGGLFKFNVLVFKRLLN